MSTGTPMVNAWIFLNEDEPAGTNYDSPNSCYQTLIQNDVYRAVDLLLVCFAEIVPAGDGTYTIQIGDSAHPGGLTNQEYLQYIVRDARQNNPNVQIGVTLDYGNGSGISQIFPDPSNPDAQSAGAFAANLVAFLRANGLNGFDLDWEYPISSDTTQGQFATLINAVGAAFGQQPQKYYLTISPAVADNLDATAVNGYVDFVNLQLYSGFTYPAAFTGIGINQGLLAYGAKFESGYQTAQAAVKDNQANYHYPIYTSWRLNSNNFVFEQAQQQALYDLVFPVAARG